MSQQEIREEDGWQKVGMEYHIKYVHWKIRFKMAWRILFHAKIDMKYSMLVKGTAYLDNVTLTLSDDVIARQVSESFYIEEQKRDFS